MTRSKKSKNTQSHQANWRPEDDPAFSDESQKYDSPIPSREFILDLMRELGEPINRRDLAERLGLVDKDALEGLRRRLIAMCNSGQLAKNRKGVYGLVEQMDLKSGRIQGHKDGYGFFIPDEGGDDLYLTNRQMSVVFDGDRVLARESDYSTRGKREAVVVEVIERAVQSVVGRYFEERGICYVEPDNQRINHQILIPKDEASDAKPGDYVVVAITRPPAWRIQPMGKIVECLGSRDIPGVEVEVAIRSYDIPFEWPKDVLSEAQRFPLEPDEDEKSQRVDLRALPFVTIDGEDARDFDDAVYCEKKRGGGWKLWVAIADVSHYVRVGGALDKEAYERATSVYFPQRVVPMLPENLSNGLCSLNPHVDRMCMVCEMSIGAGGRLSNYVFYEAVMNSHARLTYNAVATMLKDNASSVAEHAAVLPQIQQLYALYGALKHARDQRGAIEFETVETQIIYNEHKKIETILPRHRNDAHRLIEECMLCANISAAKFLEKHEVPSLYRVHEGPSEKKLKTLRQYLTEIGLHLNGSGKPSPRDYQRLMQEISVRPDASVLQIMLLRSMSQAVYQSENKGHFGLNYPAYAHFTSPIRRYPDLLVHRAIRSVIRSNKHTPHVRRVDAAPHLATSDIYPYDAAAFVVLGEHCSMAERRADDATRDVTAYLKCEYLSDRVGEEFTGIIAAVTSFGLFVELDDLYVEGLIHVSSLQNDYYHFDAVRQKMIGERSGRSFQMGDRLPVQLARVDLDDRKIDLLPVGKEGQKASLAPSRKSARSEVNRKGAERARKAKKSAKQKKGTKTKQGEPSNTSANKGRKKKSKKKPKK